MTPLSRESLFRLARFASVVVAALGSVVLVAATIVTPFPPPDDDAYRQAAERLLSGASLYVPSDPDAGSLYRYAPWFAAAWIPFAVLGDAGTVLWRLLVVASVLYIVTVVIRGRGYARLALGVLGVGVLFREIPLWNVTLPMAALLTWRRADPWSVGIAASLKIYPLILCIGYVAERRWRDLAIAVGLAGILWLPALWFGLADYAIDPGGANGLTGGWLWDVGVWPVVFLVLALGLTALAVRRSSWTWLAAAAAIPWMVPRFTGGDLTFVWPALRRLERPSSDSVPRRLWRRA
jgi:hypothetical protein